jgi:hypothetical protein
MLMNIFTFLVGLLGLLSVSYGAWAVYEPAGFIVIGSFLLWWSYLASSSTTAIVKKSSVED